jgi:hypothetical protein
MTIKESETPSLSILISLKKKSLSFLGRHRLKMLTSQLAEELFTKSEMSNSTLAVL